MTPQARKEALGAAYSAVSHILPAQAAECIGAAILSDVAIEAYEASLKEAGLVLVPREPTPDMMTAYRALNLSVVSKDNPLYMTGGVHSIWSVMLAAAREMT